MAIFRGEVAVSSMEGFQLSPPIQFAPNRPVEWNAVMKAPCAYGKPELVVGRPIYESNCGTRTRYRFRFFWPAKTLGTKWK